MDNILKKIDKLSRIKKQFIIITFDVIFIFFAVWLSFSIKLGEVHIFNSYELLLVIIAILIAIPIFISLGLYRAVIRYVSIQALLSIIKAVSLLVFIWWGTISVIISDKSHDISASILFLVWLITFFLIAGSRLLIREVFSKNKKGHDHQIKNIMIYGAGDAGVQLAKALEYENNIKLKGFIDDRKELKGKYIIGYQVYNFQSAEKLINKTKKIQEILLAIPSISHIAREKLIRKLEPLPVNVKILPSLSELVDGKISITSIKDIEINDLLGRDLVPPNKALLGLNITAKSVMITGAGGSIGSELCRQIFKLAPEKIILYERSELALYQIEKELLQLNTQEQKNRKIIPILGSVTNKKRVERVCKIYCVHTVYHAAAYKHVPMVEKNITEGIYNNVFGTLHCAQAARNAKVETFVLISTDKAVRPTNTMGATKRLAELILQAFSAQKNKQKILFSMVRFGNVLGSSGSVVPLFKEQITTGKVVTVTHAKMVRYFMSIPEAAQLVIQAGALTEGGDVFVLDMGKPVKILDLAKRMIRLSGNEVKDKNNPKGNIEIQFTDLRPGEKLYEELLIGGNISKTKHEKIMRAKEEMLPWEILKPKLNTMHQFIQKGGKNECELRKILQQVIKGFEPQCAIVDELYKAELKDKENSDCVVLRV